MRQNRPRERPIARIAPDRRPWGLLASTPGTERVQGGDVTKSEFVDQVADRADLNKKQAGDAVDAVLETIEEALKRGSEVTFSGFGKFHVAERGAREGRNPSTGEKIQIQASRVPRFTAGSGLKKSVKS
jgi:DNA-binding protein HU-beta